MTRHKAELEHIWVLCCVYEDRAGAGALDAGHISEGQSTPGSQPGPTDPGHLIRLWIISSDISGDL